MSVGEHSAGLGKKSLTFSTGDRGRPHGRKKLMQ